MRKPSGLTGKINRAFFLQAALISIAALFSVFFAKIVLEEILIKQAIIGEADFFWDKRERNPNFPLPSTRNLTGFLSADDLPPGIQSGLSDRPGFLEYENDGLVMHISTHGSQTLYLLYQRGQVDALAMYYGLLPLSLVLIVLYLSLWLTYRFSWHSISPVSWLAQQVNRIDIDSEDLSSLRIEHLPFKADGDIRILADAITNLGNRLAEFIDREHNFTRDASHELRSPLTVINIATDILWDESLSKLGQQTLLRMKRAVRDMEELTDTFLLLARESDQTLTTGSVCLNDVLAQEVEQASLVNKNQALTIQYAAEWHLETRAPDKVLSVLFGNLIRNAMQYTETGSVNIRVNKNSVVIQDSGKGISKAHVDEVFKPYSRGDTHNGSGYGVGLTIVRRLSDRFNWPLAIESSPGVGTRVEVKFPEVKSNRLPS